MSIPRKLAALAVVGALSTACDENLSTLAGPTPDLEVSFSSIQQEIFLTSDSAGRTACASCHRPGGQAALLGLDLSSPSAYDQLVNVPARTRPGSVRVIPSDPDASYLVRKIEGGPNITGLRMPLNGPPYLTSGQVTIIRRWIEIGAPRN
jgi:hypothetical protein